MSQISATKILSTFDEMVSDGSITYGSYETVKEDIDGYPVRHPGYLLLLEDHAYE